MASTGKHGRIATGSAKTSSRPKNYVVNISKTKRSWTGSHRLLIICRGRRYRLITGKDWNDHWRAHIVSLPSARYRLSEFVNMMLNIAITLAVSVAPRRLVVSEIHELQDVLMATDGIRRTFLRRLHYVWSGDEAGRGAGARPTTHMAPAGLHRPRLTGPSYSARRPNPVTRAGQAACPANSGWLFIAAQMMTVAGAEQSIIYDDDDDDDDEAEHKAVVVQLENVLLIAASWATEW